MYFIIFLLLPVVLMVAAYATHKAYFMGLAMVFWPLAGVYSGTLSATPRDLFWVVSVICYLMFFVAAIITISMVWPHNRKDETADEDEDQQRVERHRQSRSDRQARIKAREQEARDRKLGI